MRARSLGPHRASAFAVLLSPAVARAQNNTAATAAAVSSGEGWFNVNMDAGTNTQRWYRYAVVQGRSYCVEGVSDETPTTPDMDVGDNDGETDVFRADGTTLIYINDEQTEPGGGSPGTLALFPGRVCYIAPASEFNFAKVGNYHFSAIVKSYRWRIVETTLFCPWFFSGNGFEAFVLIRNTTNRPTRATVTLRSTAGAVLGTQTGTIPAQRQLQPAGVRPRRLQPDFGVRGTSRSRSEAPPLPERIRLRLRMGRREA